MALQGSAGLPVPRGNFWPRANSAVAKALASAKRGGNLDRVLDAVWVSTRAPKKFTSAGQIMQWVGRNKGALIVVLTAIAGVVGAETVKRLLSEDKVHLPEFAPTLAPVGPSEEQLLEELERYDKQGGGKISVGASPLPGGQALGLERVKRLRAIYGNASEKIVDAVRTVTVTDFAIYDQLHPY